MLPWEPSIDACLKLIWDHNLSNLLFLCYVSLMEPNWVWSWKVFSVYKHRCNFDKLNKYWMFVYTFASVYSMWKSFEIKQNIFILFSIKHIKTNKLFLELYLSAVWRLILESSLVKVMRELPHSCREHSTEYLICWNSLYGNTNIWWLKGEIWLNLKKNILQTCSS